MLRRYQMQYERLCRQVKQDVMYAKAMFLDSQTAHRQPWAMRKCSTTLVVPHVRPVA